MVGVGQLQCRRLPGWKTGPFRVQVVDLKSKGRCFDERIVNGAVRMSSMRGRGAKIVVWGRGEAEPAMILGLMSIRGPKG